MASASPISMPIPPPLLRNHSTLSSSPGSTAFDSAPGNHYLQQLNPEPEPDSESLDPLISIPSSPPSRTSSSAAAAATANAIPDVTSSLRSPRSRNHPAASTRLPSPNAHRRPGPPQTMPFGVPSFYHTAAGHPYNSYYPSDVELSTIGMGMSMYETLNPLAATVMLPGSPVATAVGGGRSGKRGVYAPIDASYYSAYTQPPPSSPFAGGAESVYGGFSTAGFGAQGVNPRYISGKSEGAANGGRDREAVLKRVKRDAGVLEEELKRLVQAQEVALGITPAREDDDATPTAMSPRESVYSARSSARNGGRQRRKLGIKEVRRGILDAMVGLADVKAVEEEWYGGEEGTRVELVDAVEKWVRKREKLEREVERVEGGREGKEMDRIRERLEGVEEQIRVHEAELKRLRAEQTGMLSKISELQSTLSSRLSSYTDTIQKMSKDMTDFLRSPNALLPTPDTKATLPFTPEQAVEFWHDERSVLETKKKETSRELDALKDGISIWQETVGLIADFEDMMARELAEAQKQAQMEAQRKMEIAEAERRKLERSRSPQIRNSVFGRGLEGERPGSSSASSGRNTPVSVFANRNRTRAGLGHSRNGSLSSSTETFKPGTAAPGGSRSPAAGASKAEPRMPEATAAKLVAGIDNIISQLNSRLTLAEQKGWTLLVCVLGAEMESYKEARAALAPLVGGLVDTSTTTENVVKNKGKGKEKMMPVAGGLASPSDEALNESLNGLNVGGGHGFDGNASLQATTLAPSPRLKLHHNHWHSESESEIDDPAALFGAEHTDGGGGDSSPELRMSPRMRRLRATSEEDELEYAAFASLNLDSSGGGGEGAAGQPSAGGAAGGSSGRASGRSTVVGEGVARGGKGKGKLVDGGDGEGGGKEEGEDIHGAFLERRDSGDEPRLI
ncbi:hypothetical protein Dda_8732 [Drechslerella dactyloides]|uniref:Uncharacterized protein n=1 Tax=Drechslerella dactyloides TaxID=74499 RepID=A0AAD6IR46_DREDA|nr:hypothetical protein Dda_8732 [Drechslerella dactyloides]